MKVCLDCDIVVPDRVEECPECEGTDFQSLLFPFYEDLEPYLEEEADYGED